MIRILHIVPKLDIGGIESMLYSYYKELFDKKKDEVAWDFVVHGTEIGLIEKKLVKMGCKVYHVCPKTDNFLKYIISLGRICSENKYHIVHAHQNDLSFIPLFIAKVMGVKIRIAHAHTCMGNPNTKNIKRIIIHYLNNLVATDFACCGSAASVWTFGEKTHSQWIPNGINVNLFKYNEQYRKELRDKYLVDDNDIVLGMVCRLSLEKNIDYSLNIIEKLNEKSSKRKYKLFIVGEGVQRSNIERKISDNTLGDCIKLIGQVDEPYKYYSFFDVFLLPSLFEGFPVSLIEAQCSSVYSIISNTISNEAIFNDNVVTCGIDMQDVETWMQLISNFKYETRFYNNTLDRFEIHDLAIQLLNYYRLLINKYYGG